MPITDQVVIDAFDPSLLTSDWNTKVLDFGTISEQELHVISLPLSLRCHRAGRVHGLACWFDVAFQGSQNTNYLSTAPGLPTTHWCGLYLELCGLANLGCDC